METRTPEEIEEHARRKAQVLTLKREGLTFEQIGQRLDPPVSRQRAHQLYWDAIAEIKAPAVAAMRQHLTEQYEQVLQDAREIFAKDHVVVSHGRVVRMEEDGEPLVDSAPKLQALARINAALDSLANLHGARVPVKGDVDNGVELKVTIVGADTGAMQ